MGETTLDTSSAMDEDESYGCKPFRPRCLQKMNNIRCHVIWQCVFNFFEGFIVNGVINVVIVALETRYSLSSTMSGLIASSNDIGNLLVLLPVSYLGEHRHKPRIMATGIAIMAIGSLVFALPHFVGEKYEYISSESSTSDSLSNVCVLNSTSSSTCNDVGQQTTTSLYAFFVIGQILLGLGACPLFTIGISYIDENTQPKMTSFYTGCVFACAAVGVAAGYVVGGQTLAVFVDVDKVDPKSIPLTPADPQWVGAWWIGILFAFFTFLFICIPFFGYPRRLPGFEELKRMRQTEAHGNGAEDVTARAGFGKSIKDFPKAIFLLVKNPAYIFVCLAATMEALIFGGTATFGAKIIQQRFQADLSTAGLIMGIITVPGAGGGMLLGGYVVKKFNLKCRGILRFCACAALMSLLLAPSFLTQCSRLPVAGVDIGYDGEMEGVSGLTSPCNSHCGCTTEGYQPLCLNSSLYFSPCHAGCTRTAMENGTKIYESCSCIQSYVHGNPPNVTAVDGIQTGICAETCAWLYVFSVLFMFIMLLTFSTMAPTVSAVLRCVPYEQRSLAVGLQLLIVRLCGTLPGPVLLGRILDSTCQVWGEGCQGRGACWLYEGKNMGYRMLAWWVVLKLLSGLCFGLASKVYRKPRDEISHTYQCATQL